MLSPEEADAQLRTKIMKAAGMGGLTTDDEIVEWVATLRQEAVRPRPVLGPSAEAMKAGLDAVEKAIAWSGLTREGGLDKIVEARRAQEREELADAIVDALFEVDLVRGRFREKQAILSVLESRDDPGAYDRIPGEEEPRSMGLGEKRPAEDFGGEFSVTPKNTRQEAAKVARAALLEHSVNALHFDLCAREAAQSKSAIGPAFPGEVTLRDQPAWFSPHSPLLRKPEAQPATRETFALDALLGDRRSWERKYDLGETEPSSRVESPKAARVKCSFDNDGDGNCCMPTCPVCRPGLQPVPDLLKAAEDVLLVYLVDETRDKDGYCRTPALRNLHLAVEAARRDNP